MFSRFESTPIWSHNAPGGNVRRDALAILRDATERCDEQDMRNEDVLGALAYLEQDATRKSAFERFRQGLEILDAAERRKRVVSAYDSIVRVLSPC
jgi:hypothetical protein